MAHPRCQFLHAPVRHTAVAKTGEVTEARYDNLSTCIIARGRPPVADSEKSIDAVGQKTAARAMLAPGAEHAGRHVTPPSDGLVGFDNQPIRQITREVFNARLCDCSILLRRGIRYLRGFLSPVGPANARV
jgi:hypothetical protein